VFPLDDMKNARRERDSFPRAGLQFQLAFVFLPEGSQFIGAGQADFSCGSTLSIPGGTTTPD